MILKPKRTLTNGIEFDLKCSKGRGFPSSYKTAYWLENLPKKQKAGLQNFPNVREKGPATSLSYEGVLTTQPVGLQTGPSSLLLLTCCWEERNANWGLRSKDELEEAWLCKCQVTESSHSFRDYLWVLQWNEYIKCTSTISSVDLKAGGGSNPIWSQTDGLLRCLTCWIIKAYEIPWIKFGFLTVTLL